KGRASDPCAENETPMRPARHAQIRDTIGCAKGGGMDAERGTQTVLITGATDGLGKAAALLLAENRLRVFAAGRSAEKRAQLEVLANEKKLPLETLEMEVCDDGSVQ